MFDTSSYIFSTLSLCSCIVLTLGLRCLIYSSLVAISFFFSVDIQTEAVKKIFILSSQISVYDGSAWSFDASRSMFYLHNFLTTQPELNLRSSGVKKELTVRIDKDRTK